MILDIDRVVSVIETVETIAWFDVRKLYEKLKGDNETDSINFWHISAHLLHAISARLGQSIEVFVHDWRARCFASDLEVMGYHCTRVHDPKIFRDQGIISLDDNSIEIFFSQLELVFSTFSLHVGQKQELIQIIKNDSRWKYRSGKGAGPYFFLSYKNAQMPGNFFHASGTEILWLFVDILLQYCQNKKIAFPCSDRNECRKIIAGELRPLIIHCAIPFSNLPAGNYYIFCMLRAFFLFIDPEDDSDNLFEGYSIDLCGNSLDPRYILKIEEINEKKSI